MISYKEAKEAMKKRGLSTDYFDEAFYQTYVADFNCAQEDHDEGRETFRETKNTLFYIKNGSSYCYFLEMVHASLPLFEVIFRIGGWDGQVLYTIKDRFPGDLEAERFARRKRINLRRNLREKYGKEPNVIHFTVKKIGEGA